MNFAFPITAEVSIFSIAYAAMNQPTGLCRSSHQFSIAYAAMNPLCRLLRRRLAILNRLRGDEQNCSSV